MVRSEITFLPFVLLSDETEREREGQTRGFDAIGEHTGDDHDRNIMVPFGGKPPGSEGPGRNRLPTVPFDGETIGVIRWRGITFQWPVIFTTDSLLLPTGSLFSFTGRFKSKSSQQVQVLCTAAQVFTENFGSLPASPPLGEISGVIAFPPCKEIRN
ncbi:hypothetical protein M5K25_006644 [Dendrobium thyrsiflorum]|uniref:Uncharacterized protein n=1 Tax=Dendrobium thyrsiflorum TaxID=117978 RepID=A0ABD0VJC8_DENTH